MTLHYTEELDDDLRRGTDENLALAAALSVDHVVLQGTMNNRNMRTYKVTTYEGVVLTRSRTHDVQCHGTLQGRTRTHQDRDANHGVVRKGKDLK